MSKINTRQLCRLCMSSNGTMVNLFDTAQTRDQSETLPMRIMMLTSVQVVDGDGLPTRICQLCNQQLERFYDFRKKCEQSDITLRELLKQQSDSDFEITEDGDGDNFLRMKEEIKVEIIDAHSPVCNDSSADEASLLQKNDSGTDEATGCVESSKLLVTSGSLPQQANKSGRARRRTCNKVHRCGECQKVFTQAGDLQIHKRIHSGERPYICDICGKSFPSSSNLARHRRIHSGEKPFCCPLCGKRFTVRSALKEHENVHSGNKRFLCKECGKSFAQKGNLKIHEMLHTGEKPHPCYVCGKRFALRGNLKDHLNIHSCEKPHRCSECGKAFTQRSTLKEHLKVHSGERPFPCAVCSKRFAYRKTLKIHMNIHTGERPHCCELCKKCFSERSHLKRHMKVHTTM